MAALITCFVVGALRKLDWLIILGFGICVVDFFAVGIAYGVKFFRELNDGLKEASKNEFTPENEAELLNSVNSASDAEESLKAQAKYYGGGAENVGELIAAAFGFTKEGRKAFKNAPPREKAKVIALFLWLGLTLLVFVVGITLSNLHIQPVGFIIMGVGGGSFFLTVIVALLFSAFERRAFFKCSVSVKRIRAVRTGVVKRCELHSQHKSGSATPQISGTLYQIWVWTSDKEPLVRLICRKKYAKYDKVEYVERSGLFKRRRIIED